MTALCSIRRKGPEINVPEDRKTAGNVDITGL